MNDSTAEVAVKVRRRTGGGPLKLNTKAGLGFYRLPFVAKTRSKVAARCWDVPATGGYFGGYKTGEAMAMAFMKCLRDGREPPQACRITSIAESFMVRFDQEGGEAMSALPGTDWSEGFQSLRGQYVGFFNALSTWLIASAVHLGSSLDGLDEAELLRQANDGLKFDEAIFFARLPG